MRKLAQLAVLAVGVALCFGNLTAQDKDKVPSVHDIMEEGHSGKKSLLNVIKASVKDEAWDKAAKPAEKFKFFGESLGKNKPEKGGADSWKKLSDEYKKTTAEIAAAVKKKDKSGAEKALGVMGKSCKACHDVHQ